MPLINKLNIITDIHSALDTALLKANIQTQWKEKGYMISDLRAVLLELAKYRDYIYNHKKMDEEFIKSYLNTLKTLYEQFVCIAFKTNYLHRNSESFNVAIENLRTFGTLFNNYFYDDCEKKISLEKLCCHLNKGKDVAPYNFNHNKVQYFDDIKPSYNNQMCLGVRPNFFSECKFTLELEDQFDLELNTLDNLSFQFKINSIANIHSALDMSLLKGKEAIEIPEQGYLIMDLRKALLTVMQHKNTIYHIENMTDSFIAEYLNVLKTLFEQSVCILHETKHKFIFNSEALTAARSALLDFQNIFNSFIKHYKVNIDMVDLKAIELSLKNEEVGTYKFNNPQVQVFDDALSMYNQKENTGEISISYFYEKLCNQFDQMGYPPPSMPTMDCHRQQIAAMGYPPLQQYQEHSSTLSPSMPFYAPKAPTEGYSPEYPTY